MKKHTQSPYESSKVSYKPSGIEWLGGGGGKIPTHWEVKPLQAIFNQRNEQNNNLEFQTILSLVKDVGVIPYEEKGNVGNKAKDDLQGYKIARVNDLVLNKMNAVIGSLGVSKYDGLVSPIYLVLYIENPNYLIAYYSYLFQTKSIQKFLRKFAYGIMEIRESIDYLEFKKMFLPIPPLQEQKEIAEFLDKKCEKIQNYINKKQKLITLLQEKKQALINQAVTKGLNPNIEFKPSGIEYLGLIPHHWEVRRVATLGKFFKGSNISKNDLQDSGVCVVLYGDIYTKYEIKTKQFHSKIAENFAKDKTQILFGDLLFSGSGETKEDIGKCICYLGNEKAYVGGDVIVLRQMGQDSLFLSYVLNSDYIKYQKAVVSKGEIIIHIYASNLRDLKIPLPPLQEQKEIAEFLDSKVAQINSVIEKTKKQIELIKEYKNTLINEAICGRVACSRDFSPTAQNDKMKSGFSLTLKMTKIKTNKRK
ncbi:restriction endonuclease subunit S [Campylobacter vulpis]|uniref:restriction endonuclease subunit S n=1 Tax=Campylobacter vulpis TaxID=1655500 RepID=UPI001BD03A64|nr:restriction endonuclease subunit S [Campylobacter vulpis]MBS4329950.1 restriction endonuclease subunit S [Campylobacter vulpis]